VVGVELCCLCACWAVKQWPLATYRSAYFFDIHLHSSDLALSAATAAEAIAAAPATATAANVTTATKTATTAQHHRQIHHHHPHNQMLSVSRFIFGYFFAKKKNLRAKVAAAGSPAIMFLI
jgi:hypothetical protein